MRLTSSPAVRLQSMHWLGLPLAVTFLLFLWACAGVSTPATPPAPPATLPLNAANINLIFVVSEDLTYQAYGDINPKTANLTDQGLQRSLLMGSFLKKNVLGGKNVTSIYALEPMTHLQTSKAYPDLVGLETVQQFALLNQITLSLKGVAPFYTGYGYTIHTSYAPGSVPNGVAPPAPSLPCPYCQGLDFSDQDGSNETLVEGILKADVPGFYVFSAPWETMAPLLLNVSRLGGYGLAPPGSYQGPNFVYAITIVPAGGASLVTYNANLNPAFTYPQLPAPPLRPATCTAQTHFNIATTGGIPGNSNKNETVYLIRHANAHPTNYFADDNYVGAGQWRVLDLPNALRGKIFPQQVYSLDPAQVASGSVAASGDDNWSHLTLALTVEPYAIANNLPYHLVSSFLLSDTNSPQEASDFFFTGGKFSGQKVLVAWEHSHISPMIDSLLSTYGNNQPTTVWPPNDYDTIWTVRLDAEGNVAANNLSCEGIDSKPLPAQAPQF